jgi:hypothetical protein
MKTIMKLLISCFISTLAVLLVLADLHAPRPASAGISTQGTRPIDQPVAGLVSNALRCLAVGRSAPGQASGVVRLNWSGKAERARLILTVSGAEAAHSIKVNGRRVGSVPVYQGGQPCRGGEVFYIDVPIAAVTQGDNQIEITNDAQNGDSWTAAQVRLEVLGALPLAPLRPASVGASTAITFVATFINPYDGTSQEAIGQIPASYNPASSTPLVIYVHGRSGAMEDGLGVLGAAADAKGWLLASAQLHGSWTGTITNPIPNPPGKYAYASLESQYDIVGTVGYMRANYTVNPDRIYLVGDSMGGQIAVVTIAKFPHLFAAVFDNKGPTNMVQWYDENPSFHQDWMERECHIDGVPKTPAENPFCYQRRSGVNFASNFIHIPISLTHSISDTLVPIHHSRDLRDAINSFGPDRPAVLFEENSHDPLIDGGSACSYHCYEPDPLSELSFLEQFVLNDHPTHINVTSDESKSYYWMNLALTGGDHWSQVSAIDDPISATVLATISETQPLTVAFNLGATPLTGTAGISQPGMGLPATTYLIKGGGNNAVSVYTSGYLTVPLASTGEFSLTIAALDASLSANPFRVAGGRVSSSTITAAFEDHLNNPVPDGVVVKFSASAGLFPNGASIYTATTSGGQATALLTLLPGSADSLITASIGSVGALTAVEVIAPIYLPAVMKN